MTFLELCKMTVQQSGTIEGDLPVSVTGQVRRLKQIVDFVREAYVDIQNAHLKWRWLGSYFTGQTVIGQNRYSGSTFTDEPSGLPATRFSTWDFRQAGDDRGLSMYLTSAGPQEEGAIRWLDPDLFYETQLRGVRPHDKPSRYTVANDGALLISPTPDKVYTLRGPYRKSPQMLMADGDVPEMPVNFHTIIKDAALAYLEGFDEGPRIPVYRLRMLPNWSMLELAQLPKVKWGAPLA